MKHRLKVIPAAVGIAAASLFVLLTTAAAQQVQGPPAPDPVLSDVANLARDYAATTQASTQRIATLTAQVQQMQQAPANQPARPQYFGVNLEAVSYYNRMPLFADAALQSTLAGDPAADTTFLLFSQATGNYAGAYTFRCNGQPTLAVVNSFGTISNQNYDVASDTTTATVTVTTADFQKFSVFGQPQLGLSIGNVVAGKVRNVQVWRPGYVPGSQRFTNEIVKAIAPFDTVRFMDALGTNGSMIVNWSDRPLPTDRNYTGKGMCYEDVFGLCRQAGKAPWVCLPCQATPDYLTQFISLTKAQAGPEPVYLEWSNEIWNSAFPQWKQAMALAAADKSLAYDGTGDPNILLYRWMGKQAVNISKAAQAAYGVNDIRLTPIRPILAGQWGNPDVLKYAMDYIATQVGPPNQYIYAIAIAPYATLSGNMWGRIQSDDPTVTEQQIVADYAASGANNSSGSTPLVAAFVAQAKQYGLHTRAYEFGFDSGQAQQCVAQKNAAAHDPAMGPIVTAYVNNWWAAGCEGLNWFTLTAADTSNGQWGLTADTYDVNTPKYQAAVAAAQATAGTH